MWRNSNCVRGVFGGGWKPSDVNTIEYVNISTGGNAVDFGDRTIKEVIMVMGASNGHGGLG